MTREAITLIKKKKVITTTTAYSFVDFCILRIYNSKKCNFNKNDC